MADQRTTQGVRWEVGARKGEAWIKLSTPDVPPIEIGIEPQAAFEMGEGLARVAHHAKFGKPPQSDRSYLQEQIKSRVTDQLREWMVNRVTHMLKTLRTDPAYKDRKLAETLVDTILTKVA